MVRLTLVNGNYQKTDGREFISIFTDLGSFFFENKNLRSFYILECWLKELSYIFPFFYTSKKKNLQ